MRKLSEFKEVVRELERRATALERAAKAIITLSELGYPRSEKRDRERWMRSKQILEAEGFEVPSSALLCWDD